MKRPNRMNISTVILIFLGLIGLSLLLYPSAADYYNTHIAMRTVTDYNAKISDLEEDEFREMWTAAVAYNRELAGLGMFSLPEDMERAYYGLLNASDNGMMGYIEIPKMNTLLPLYHGTNDAVLASAIGHLEWSSLPTGGPGTHCCVSGHRGLTTARLFTDLDMLREGDLFMLNILDEVLTYEVDQIRTVLPEDSDYLQIEEGKDYCTLITCTPYGVNTHRLLVRGHRIENIIGEARVVSEAVLIDQKLVAVVLAIPILFALFMMVMLKKPEKKVAPSRPMPR